MAAPGLGKQLEFLKIVNQDGFVNVLRECAFIGELTQRPSVRGLCWKLFLAVLSEDKSEWIKRSNESREEYEGLRKKYLFDPHEVKQSLDVVKNNPLSQDETSPWNKYFQDNELRRTIETDVLRTFPEVHFFREESVRSMMKDILFCYAKDNPDNGYKQVHLFVPLSLCLSVCLFVRLFLCLFLCTYLSVCLPVSLCDNSIPYLSVLPTSLSSLHLSVSFCVGNARDVGSLPVCPPRQSNG
jgi:hypothetical protein